MEGSRHYWESIAVGGTLAAGALIFGRPILLIGAAGIWTWALIHQLRFVQSVATITETLSVTQSVGESVVATGDELEIQVTAEFDGDATAPDPLRVRSRPPLVATLGNEADPTIDLDPGDRRGTTTYHATMGAAGRTAPRGVRFRLRDTAGLFTQTWTRANADSRPPIDVRPYGPRNIHVGAGTERIGQGYGEHDTEFSGGGIEPLELREYVPGDALARIDWKATARLAEPYIREYEASTDRTTLLVVDHRSEMGEGRPGRTMLHHGRSIGTAVIEAAETLNDPLGWITVGNDGITERTSPRSTSTWYERARRTLNNLEPTPEPPTEDPTAQDTAPAPDAAYPGTSHQATTTQPPTAEMQLTTDSSGDQSIRSTLASAPLSATERRRIGQRLDDDTSAFGTSLQPFFVDTTEYVHRVSAEPLFEGLRVGLRRRGGATWSVIVTSDARPAEVLETVRFARRGDNHVLVFLTPSVLFGPTAPDNLEAAYEQYRAFERFRDRLDQYQRVSAFEVGPRDRLADILRDRRSTEAGDNRRAGRAD